MDNPFSIEGRATFTMETSRKTMNCAMQRNANTTPGEAPPARDGAFLTPVFRVVLDMGRLLVHSRDICGLRVDTTAGRPSPGPGGPGARRTICGHRER